MTRIYLDYAATTPLDPLVLESMLPYFSDDFGNPSSIHRFGQRAESALENARSLIADLVDVPARQIVFTSGGTESDNLAIRGAAFSAKKARNASEILITPVEHPAVSNTVRDLVKHYGFTSRIIPVNANGAVNLGGLEDLISSQTALVSAIFANNEIGTINPISEISEICKNKGVVFHTDAVQASGLIDINASKVGYDLLSMGGHKFYGPKGVGALVCAKPGLLRPIQTGGAQENGFRAGTENVPLIVGLAKAFELAQSKLDFLPAQLQKMRDRIIQGVCAQIPGATLTGDPEKRLPNHASFVFPRVDGNQLVMLLDHAGFACSSGSACKTGNPEPSEVLLAIGMDPEIARGSLRVTLGKDTTEYYIEKFLRALPAIVEKARVS